MTAGLDPLAPTTVGRSAADGRVLAEPVHATVDVPPCDVSAMDGYVVPEPVEAGQVLPVSTTIAAGDAPGRRLEPGRAARIMTGAPVPANAHAVVPVEQTDAGADDVTFTTDSKAGAHIRRAGEVTAVGSELLEARVPLTAHALGLLATHGIEPLPVFGAPRVAVLATGDEIVAPDEVPGPGHLRDSHTDFLLASGRLLGLKFHSLGIARDDETVLRKSIGTGLTHDVLLITGGVSKGLFDLVEGVLESVGCETLFDAVAIQPGKPLVFARHSKGWVFGLPGNPASVMTCYWLFVRPFLRVLMGHADGFWFGAVNGQLAASLPGAKKRDRFVTASIETRGGEILVSPHSPVGSHDLVAYGRGTALVRIRAHASPAKAGEPCEVLLL